MKNAVRLAILSCTLVSSFAEATVIYGEDNRKEVFESSARHQLLARSTPIMVPKEAIITTRADRKTNLLQTSLAAWMESQDSSEEEIEIDLEELLGGLGGGPIIESKRQVKGAKGQSSLKFCPGERYVEQPNPGVCSGFLIAPDLVVTAGHCGLIENACADYKWVFDFKVDEATLTAGQDVSADNIYSCKRIITNSMDMLLGTDFSVIQLDRKVVGREPLDVRLDGVIGTNTEILVIGNPSGLPLKVTDKAYVRKNDHSMFFSANLDTFQGNSGSAVFNAETGVVEGILVRGEEDFNYSPAKMCLEVNKCADDACRGEDVSRITSIPEVALKNMLNEAAVKGDVKLLEKIHSLKVWIDFYTKDGETSLMKAAAAGMTSSITTLLAKGADVTLTDAAGNTALHHLAKSLTPANAGALAALVAAGGKLDVKNNKGLTPAMLAESAQNTEGLKLLLQSGAQQ